LPLHALSRAPHRREHVIALLLLGVAAAAPAATDPPETWTTRRPIGPPAITAASFVETRLDAAVYAVAATSLTDLRVRERGGADVAYTVRRHDGQMPGTER